MTCSSAGREDHLRLDRLARLTAGAIEAGSHEPILFLLTADPDGVPRVCALSRNEVEVVDEWVHVAIHARRTSADIERTGAATMTVVDGVDIISYRLRL